MNIQWRPLIRIKLRLNQKESETLLNYEKHTGNKKIYTKNTISKLRKQSDNEAGERN